MKHILFGGNGFVGRYIARDLMDIGETVLICDLPGSHAPIYAHTPLMQVDITQQESIGTVPIDPDDIVYNLAARMLHPIVPRHSRYRYFYSVDYFGGVKIIEAMERAGCCRLVQFSTDMVYGKLQTASPAKVDHPRAPLGEYSASKKALEDYCIEKRRRGLKVSIFRPRLINGPGRAGALGNLFRLIRNHLPVPIIGNGSNRYQMVSVFDCARAAVSSARAGVIDGEFNLGSAAPPTVRNLLDDLIRHADSRSFLVPTPANLVKDVLRLLDHVNLPLLVPEQFEVADNDYVLDIETTVRQLNWQPRHSDRDMMFEAYREFAAISLRGKPTMNADPLC
jgi:dTDP-glucose 4,6-dehydratase